jgi:ATP-binding cassette, subfamily B, bacterial MsbA
MKVIKRLLKYASPLHHYLPEYIIYTILGILFGLLNFTMLIPIFNILFGIDNSKPITELPSFSFSVDYFISLFSYYFTGIINAEGKFYALGFVCAIIFVAAVLANLFRFLAIKVMVRLRLNMMERLRNDLYAKLTHQSLHYYHNAQKGNILSAVTNEVQEIENSVVNSLQIWFRDPFSVVFYFITLFYVSPRLTLFTIVFLPVSGLLIASITNKLRRIGHFNVGLLGKILSHTEETISGIRVIQSFAAEKYSISRFKRINREFSKSSKKMFSRRELTLPLSEVLGITVVVIIIMYGGYLLLKDPADAGSLTGSLFIFYLILFSQILQPLKNISQASGNAQRGIVAAEKIFSVLDEPVKIEEKANTVEKTSFDHTIELKNVSFRYTTQDVLSNIDLVIPKRKSIALVGESGSGKSTLADLISRFYDPTEGEVLIDGIDAKNIKLTHLRSLISFVSQDAVLFNDTIFNNIAFGAPDASFEKVKYAASIANADSFIEQTDNGYNTIIGDRGMNLSGGQRQRLTIARAVFKDAPILILDEATSALDMESERLVQDAINKMMEHCTSIIIAHRLSTIRHVDEIIVLQKGRIVERGNHEELLKRQGYYYRLVQMQDITTVA